MKFMEKVFLEEPKIDRKQDALDYLKEFVKYKYDFNGVGGLERCLSDISYEQWILELEKRKDIKYVNKINRCLSNTYFVVREDDNKIVGMINVRYNISDKRLKEGASHIGYGIRPTERKKGYAKMALYLGLIEEKKLGEEKVLLVCDVNNIGSNKAILSMGGVLEKTELDKSDNIMTNYYWIDVNYSIQKRNIELLK